MWELLNFERLNPCLFSTSFCQRHNIMSQEEYDSVSYSGWFSGKHARRQDSRDLFISYSAERIWSPFSVSSCSKAVLLNFCTTLNDKHLRSSEDLRISKVPIHPLASLSCENRYSLNVIKLNYQIKIKYEEKQLPVFFRISNGTELVWFLYTCVLNYNGTALS